MLCSACTCGLTPIMSPLHNVKNKIGLTTERTGNQDSPVGTSAQQVLSANG